MPSSDIVIGPDLDEAIEQRVQEILARKSAQKKKRLALVASKGTLDMAYPPLILATTAASMGWEVGIFCTFYGLDILNKKKIRSFKVAPLGNPAMPVPVPNIIGALPGMTAVATAMMKNWMTRAKIPPLHELLAIAQEGKVRLFACTTTMGVMGVQKADIIGGAEFAGAATFLDYASEAEVTLFI
jgi:peroxiredoxin family protein